ncbi:SAM-dependent methyltransferase [Nocardia sp. NBC_01327]|uniref:SAM-dependent methyltransferase n=1 Tax=Nocardia sp. NBC_01327 TaxID=2903593 RepID=UPI002E127241|nr:SAM-dependent methyltransferase [Nocardia sp. NBC_01327]
MSYTDRTPARVDTSQPSIARAYDAVLGGKDNYEADRLVARQLAETLPGIGDLARYNRAVLARGVRYLADEAGISQFLDLGAGLPTMENTHQVAQRVRAQARVAYVDIDPMVLAHGRALLMENEYTTVITADLRQPDSVLAHPEVRALLDFTQPVAVMLVGILHHLHDSEDPQGVVDAYMSAVPSGSQLFITHFCDSGPEAHELEQTFLQFLGTGRFRTHAEIARFFGDCALAEPGLVPLPLWRPDGVLPEHLPLHEQLTLDERLMIAGIARKP